MTHKKDPFQDQQALLSGRSVISILDIGANIGDITAAYRSVFPEAVIYGFEPFPAAFDQYRRRFEGNRFVRPISLRLGDKPEQPRSTSIITMLPTPACQRLEKRDTGPNLPAI